MNDKLKEEVDLLLRTAGLMIVGAAMSGEMDHISNAVGIATESAELLKNMITPDEFDDLTDEMVSELNARTARMKQENDYNESRESWNQANE